MGQRFERDRINGQELAERLDEIGMSENAFMRVFGVAEKQMKGILEDRAPIPNWVPVVLSILQNCPGAIAEARNTSAHMISLDTHNPDRGEYPYLKQENQND